MSESWAKTTLGEICAINLGQSPSSDTYNQEKIGLPFFQGKSEFGSKYAQATIWCSEPQKIADKGDILISVRAPVGESNLAPEECCIGRGLASLRASQICLDQEFLWHYIESRKIDLQGIAQGSTFDAISGKDLDKMIVQLPPLPEQKKIAEILSGIDKLLEIKKRSIERKQMILRFITEDAVRQESSRKIVPLGIIGKWKGGGTPSKRVSEFWNGTIPWISPKDMRADKIFSSQDYISELALENSSTSLIPVNSILFVTRSGILRHALPISITTKDVAINQDLKALIPNSEWDPNFLIYFLKGRSSDILSSCMKSGTTVESIDTTQLQNYKVPFVTIETQRRISALSESVARAIDAEISEIESLKILRSGLSSDLLSGRKRVAI